MEGSHLMLFVCIAAPLSMMLLVFKGRSRAILGFLLTGIFMALFAGEISGLINGRSDVSLYFLTVNISPVVEEVLKAFPVIFIAFLVKPDRQLLLEGAVSVGVGFATMENVCLMFDSSAALPALTLICRGFGAGMMHGVSTLAVGYSMTVVSKTKKLSYTGTIASLAAAVIYHSIYNIIVQSSLPALGILLPIITFIPLVVFMRKNRLNYLHK